jgi:hypothetical protein
MAPPRCAAAGSQVAPIPIDCGNSGSCHGWLKPWMASMPKISGMCSREFAIAYFWISLYSLAQSWAVLPEPPFPVVSTGLSEPPARIEPVCWSISTLCMHV